MSTGNANTYLFNFVADSNETYISRPDGQPMSVREQEALTAILEAVGHKITGGHEWSVSVQGKINTIR